MSLLMRTLGNPASTLKKTEEEEMKKASGMISVLLIKVLVSPEVYICINLYIMLFQSRKLRDARAAS